MSVLEATPVVLDRLERINAQVREVHPGLSVLAFVAAVLMWVGRIPAYLVTAVVWSFVAVRLGYREVRPPREPAADDGPTRRGGGGR